MRDIFDDIYKNNPLDPNEAARRAMRPDLRKRFYKAVAVREADGAFQVLLDDRLVRTPARKPLALPSRDLAQALATEWEAQTDAIDPARMPLTRLCNSIIDGVTERKEAVASDILKYLATDLLFYRADGPEGLIERQAAAWDPPVLWARDRHGAHFILAQGVVHVAQPPEALAAIRRAMTTDAWRLGAMHTVTTLTGSALLAVMLEAGAAGADQVWDAAHVDEDFNTRAWGRDAQAEARRAFRAAEFKAAVQVLDAV
jgi:chaperone required for assembly of F1-ATPase